MKVKFSILTTGILAGILCFAVSCNDVGDLEGRVGNLEQQVKDLKGTEVASLANQVKALNEFKAALEGLNIPEKYSDLLKQIGDLQGGLSGVQNDVADILATMAKNNDLLALVGRVDKIENEQIADILRRLGAAEGDIQKIEGDITGLTNDLNKANDRIAAIEAIDVEGKLAAINGEIQKLWDKIGEILTQAGIDEEKIAQLEEDFGKAKERLDDAENNIKDLKQKLETAQADINDILNTTIPAINDRIDEQVKKLQEAQADIAKKADQTYVDQKFKELTEGTIKTIQDAVSSLDGKVAGLETVIGTVQNRINGISDSVKTNAEDIKTNAENIKANAEDIAKALDQIKGLGEQISSLRGELMGEIGKINAKFNDYVLTSTFNQFKKTVYTKAQIDGVIDELINLIVGNDYYILDYVDSIGNAHSDSLAAHLARIEALENANTQINGEIDNLWSKIGDLEEADEKLEERMKNALTHAMDSLDTYVIGELPEGLTIAAILADHEQAISDIQDSIDVINGRISEINGRLVDVEDLLKNRFQSLVFVPDYNDLAFTVNNATLAAGQKVISVEMPTINKYRIQPAELAKSVVDAWTVKTLNASLETTIVKTRGSIKTDTAKFIIKGMEVVDAENGIIAVTSVLAEPISSESVNLNAVALVLSDDHKNNRTTTYTMCKSMETTVNFALKPLASEDTTEIRKAYNDDSDATFFKTNDAGTTFQPLFWLNSDNTKLMTAAKVKEETAIDVTPFIIQDLDSINPAKDTVNIFNMTDYYIVNLTSDKSKTVQIVGDTAKVYKKYAMVMGTQVGDTVWAEPFVGLFIIDPLKPEVTLNAYIKWNLIEDAKGDVYRTRGKTQAASWKYYENAAKAEVVKSTLDGSDYTFESFSHQDTIPGTLKRWKVKKNGNKLDTTEVKDFNPLDRERQECLIENIKMTAGADGKPELSFTMKGIDFEAVQYIVEAQYLPKKKDGSIGQDITTITLNIFVQDRDRDIKIRHTYSEIKLDVDKDFGGDTILYLQSSDEKIEWSYFAELLKLLNQPDTLKFSDYLQEFGGFTTPSKKSYANIYDNKSANVGYELEEDSIKLSVTYSKDDIDENNPGSFTIKDTLVNGAGDTILIEIPFVLNWPKYNFYHNEYYVAGTDNNYYSSVQPWYDPTKEILTKFDVTKVKMAENFWIVDAAKSTTEKIDTANLGLSVKYGLRPMAKTVSATIDPQTGIIDYRDSLEYILPYAKLYLNVDGKDFPLTTNFDGTGVYNNYKLYGYNPFLAFRASGNANIQIKEYGQYPVNVFKYLSLTDKRNKECLDYMQAGGWKQGNGTAANGFTSGITSYQAYQISNAVITYDTNSIPKEIAQHITFDEQTNVLNFDYTNEVTLVKDIVIPVTYKFNSIFSGTMSATVNVTFLKPQQN